MASLQAETCSELLAAEVITVPCGKHNICSFFYKVHVSQVLGNEICGVIPTDPIHCLLKMHYQVFANAYANPGGVNSVHLMRVKDKAGGHFADFRGELPARTVPSPLA